MSQTNCPYTPSGPVHVDPLTPEELGDVARMAEDGLLDFPAAITHVFSDGVSTYDVLAFEEDEELSDFKKTLGDKAPRWIREARTVSAFVYAADYANSVIDHAVRRGQFDRMMEAYVSSKRRAS